MKLLRLFNRWDTSTVKVNDVSLREYINLDAVVVPRTGGRNNKTRVWGKKTNVVEKLMNKLMVSGHRGRKHKLTSGHNTGKSIKLYNIVYRALNIVEKNTNKNPIEVFVKAIENAAPREEITTIEYGGARYPQAVDCSPLRRLDLALRIMAQGAYTKSFKNKKRIEEALAEEIIKAYNNDNTSTAIAKRIEVERQAESSR